MLRSVLELQRGGAADGDVCVVLRSRPARRLAAAPRVLSRDSGPGPAPTPRDERAGCAARRQGVSARACDSLPAL